jgi:hypothetical protein
MFDEHSFKISAVEGTVMSFKGTEEVEQKYLFTISLLNKEKIVSILNIWHLSLSRARANTYTYTK